MLNRYFAALGGSAGVPAGAELSIWVVLLSVDSYGFMYSLSRPLTSSFVLDRILAYNYIECGDRAQGVISLLEDYTVEVGDTGDIITPDSSTGSTNTELWKVNFLRLNGAIVSNGETISIGGQDVLVRLQQCS